jgi:hypothetical protein
MVSINLCDINGNSSKVLGWMQNSIHGANGVWIGNKHWIMKLWISKHGNEIWKARWSH